MAVLDTLSCSSSCVTFVSCHVFHDVRISLLLACFSSVATGPVGSIEAGRVCRGTRRHCGIQPTDRRSNNIALWSAAASCCCILPPGVARCFFNEKNKEPDNS